MERKRPQDSYFATEVIRLSHGVIFTLEQGTVVLDIYPAKSIAFVLLEAISQQSFSRASREKTWRLQGNATPAERR